MLSVLSPGWGSVLMAEALKAKRVRPGFRPSRQFTHTINEEFINLAPICCLKCMSIRTADGMRGQVNLNKVPGWDTEDFSLPIKKRLVFGFTSLQFGSCIGRRRVSPFSHQLFCSIFNRVHFNSRPILYFGNCLFVHCDSSLLSRPFIFGS